MAAAAAVSLLVSLAPLPAGAADDPETPFVPNGVKGREAQFRCASVDLGDIDQKAKRSTYCYKLTKPVGGKSGAPRYVAAPSLTVTPNSTGLFIEVSRPVAYAVEVHVSLQRPKKVPSTPAEQRTCTFREGPRSGAINAPSRYTTKDCSRPAGRKVDYRTDDGRVHAGGDCIAEAPADPYYWQSRAPHNLDKFAHNGVAILPVSPHGVMVPLGAPPGEHITWCLGRGKHKFTTPALAGHVEYVSGSTPVAVIAKKDGEQLPEVHSVTASEGFGNLSLSAGTWTITAWIDECASASNCLAVTSTTTTTVTIN